MGDEENIQRFLGWFRGHGGSFHPKLDVIHDADHGIHVRTREDLDPTTGKVAICKCPLGLSLSPLNVRKLGQELGNGSSRTHAAAGPVAQALHGHAAQSVISHFMLMEQKSFVETSFWYPYIQLLPKPNAMTTPLYFGNGDLAWLLGTNMHVAPGKSAVEERLAAHKRDWESAIAQLAGQDLDSGHFTFDWYLWAATIFTSRAFSSAAVFGRPEDAFAILYPGVDFLNHHPLTEVTWDFDRGSFTLSTTLSLLQGAEVYNNYAPKGNEELLMGYGFAIEDNPSDTVRVVLPPPPAPVHQNLRRALPEHFKSETWKAEEASFELRGLLHHAGGYDHGIACLRGVPYAMFRMMAELVYFMSTQELDGAGDALQDDDFFAFVIEQFLNPLRSKRMAIPDMVGEPRNQKQKYAKIYRDGQTRILNEVIFDLERSLGVQEPIPE